MHEKIKRALKACPIRLPAVRVRRSPARCRDLVDVLSCEAKVQMLVSRVGESQLAEASGSYLLALFGIGSFVEGLLHSVLTSQHPELVREGFMGRNGNKVRADRAGLELLLDAAHDRGLIQLDAKDFMRPVREFRNYIHPRRQFETNFTPDADTVAMCWTPVQALLNDFDMVGGGSAVA